MIHMFKIEFEPQLTYTTSKTNSKLQAGSEKSGRQK